VDKNQTNDLINKILPVLLERDQLRTYLSVAGYCRDVFEISLSDGEYLAHKLKQLNLAYFLRPDGDMRITPNGREIQTSGGWARHVEREHAVALLKENEKALAINEDKLEKQHLKYERAQERLIAMQERIQKATLEEYQLKLNEMNVKIAKKSANASWFAGAIGLLALLYSLYQGYRANDQNDDINRLKQEVVRMDSLVKIRQNIKQGLD
jgi:hypothetical protein